MADRRGVPVVGGKPNRTVMVPQEYRLHASNMASMLKLWYIETRCTIVANSERFGNGRVQSFDLFGNSAQIEEAVKAIHKWMEDSRVKNSSSVKLWGKLKAFDVNSWYYKEIENLELDRKRVFQGPVPEDNPPKFQAIVPWRPELSQRQITPRDVFRNKLEGLDHIRFLDEVFINILPQHPEGPNTVSIRGYGEKNVRDAERHYENLMKKVCLQKAFGATAVNIVLDGAEGENVILEAVPRWWPLIQANTACPHLKLRPSGDLTKFDLGSFPGSFRDEGLGPGQLRIIQQAIEAYFETVRYERGSFNFTVRYGCLNLLQVPEDKLGKSWTLNEFRRHIDNNKHCLTRKWAFDTQSGHGILSRIMDADFLMEPVKLFSTSSARLASSLKEVAPSFRGTWAIKDPDSLSSQNIKFPPSTPPRNPGRPMPRDTRDTRRPNPSNSGLPVSNNTDPAQIIKLIIVEIDWTRDENGNYEKMPPKFSRLKPGQRAPSDHMDINLMELGKSQSWHFGLESMIPISPSKIPPVLLQFAADVELRTEFTKNPDSGDFVRESRSRSINVVHCRRDKIYTFGIKNTKYRVDIVAMWYPRCKIPCWGITVRHQDWPMYLDTLEHLAQGECAEWKDIIAAFFPDNGMTSEQAHRSPDILAGLAEMTFNDDKEDRKEDRKQSGESHREGVRLLVRNLMAISRIINATDVVPARPSLGTGIAIRDDTPVLIDLSD
ncbi:hypothetical protein B0J11DRAFT_602983 [Dendryphion nanum]|uniref:DUF7905 domain-containing protein n=1 Tax=Dendryphion nanum TaxID=256645 RepID=A0A9P9E4M0_9PLEO|nr:hypothetical protein B0J11DRAFT_602983 [Dendryphion nanum]